MIALLTATPMVAQADFDTAPKLLSEKKAQKSHSDWLLESGVVPHHAPIVTCDRTDHYNYAARNCLKLLTFY
jgi:hypothetical protein